MEPRSYSVLLPSFSVPVREISACPFGPFTMKCMSAMPFAIFPFTMPFRSMGSPTISITVGHRSTRSTVALKTSDCYA